MRVKPIKIGLHLQGGGSFGAWQAGALTAILERPDIFNIIYISGTSAGAVNGGLIAQAVNGAARPQIGYDVSMNSLRDFWQDVGEQSRLPNHVVEPGNIPVLAALNNLHQWHMTWNPFYNDNFYQHFLSVHTYHASATLRGMLQNAFALHANGNLHQTGPQQPLKLYVNAAIKDGAHEYKDVVFGGLKEVNIRHIMASTALKHVFNAEVFKDQDLIDGAYAANPSFTPYLLHKDAVDAVVTIAANRPELNSLQSRPQSELRHNDKAATRGLVLDQMFGEILHHVQAGDMPTQHAVIFNQTAFDFTAKQNTHPVWLQALYERGVDDGRKQLAGIDFARHSVSRDSLVTLVQDAGSQTGLLPADFSRISQEMAANRWTRKTAPVQKAYKK